MKAMRERLVAVARSFTHTCIHTGTPKQAHTYAHTLALTNIAACETN